ncbi:MAG: hypothetical protein Unbinned92contig1002_1 [Prokaryotic dsDNA virus sp.]|nr:MAG: hypothetical protein Unbinned92contig1002_1 [Prokaryotic dsDNA virus sp.]|tara:strand:- start:20344 stop:20874 length:531 start_codon:yes stop_codon:yes gene_type:complete
MRGIKEGLQNFAKAVVNAARFNLANDNKNVTKKLSDSINYDVLTPKEGLFVIEFVMNTYGLFVDKGVSGTKRRVNSPYSFKSKGGKQGLKGMPPPSKFDQWTVRRGIAPRDKKGRFLPRKSVDFAIARSVFERGIKPSLFFTKPFNKFFEGISEGILKEFNTEIITTINKLDNAKN